MIKLKKFLRKDVTEDYYKNLNDEHILTIDKSYDIHKFKEEIEVAHLLIDLFEEHLIIKDAILRNKKNPDYLWNDQLWELKTPKYEKSANVAVRKAINQIEKNPGGIILDYRNKAIDFDLLMNYIDYRIDRSSKSNLDLIILMDYSIKIYRYIYRLYLKK